MQVLFPKKTPKNVFFPIVVPENNFNFNENSSLSSIKDRIRCCLHQVFISKEQPFHGGFLMAATSAAGSFGYHLVYLPADGTAKCHGDAENRVLKRVGGKN